MKDDTVMTGFDLSYRHPPAGDSKCKSEPSASVSRVSLLERLEVLSHDFYGV